MSESNYDIKKELLKVSEKILKIEKDENSVFKITDNPSGFNVCIEAANKIRDMEKEINALRDLVQELRWNNGNKT